MLKILAVGLLLVSIGCGIYRGMYNNAGNPPSAVATATTKKIIAKYSREVDIGPNSKKDIRTFYYLMAEDGTTVAVHPEFFKIFTVGSLYTAPTNYWMSRTYDY